VSEPEDTWQRLHPLSPVVRGGKATIGLAIVLVPIALGRRLSDSYPQLGVVAVIVALGFVSWLVTRWRIDGDDLRIETGLLRRRSLRFPLSQVQAIDVVQPGLARMFRVAELRLRMGGSTGTTARLAYLPEREIEPLRLQLLSLARRDGAAPPVDAPAPEERVLARVRSGQLAASILTSDVGLYAELILLALVLGVVFARHATAGIAGGGFVWILGSVAVVWRRFNQEFGLTVSEDHEGLHLRGGLIALTAETIRPGRVQAVRLVEPLLWRTVGWCRLEVDVAGRQRSKGEGEAQRGRLRAVLPVGSLAVAEELLDVLVPDRPRHLDPPPSRAFWKSPLRYRKLAWARTDTCVAARSGRLRRVTSWVPLEKVQSLRRVQGPIQRRFTLATVHVDTAGRGVHASLRDRDSAEAEQALVELTDLARAARRAA
jgi:putative membrane protein